MFEDEKLEILNEAVTEIDSKQLSIYPWWNGETGEYENITLSWETVRHADVFENIVTNPNQKGYPGDFAKFSYEHGIGLDNFTEQKSAAHWITEESHYYRRNFFYVTGLAGKENTGVPLGKNIASFLLRVSNHPVSHKEWDVQQGSDRRIQGEFCLNLLINPEKAPNNKKRERDEAENRGCTVIQCDISDYYTTMNPARKQRIDNLVNSILAGESPTVSYEELQTLCDPDKFWVRTTGPEHTEIQFQKRGPTALPPPPANGGKGRLIYSTQDQEEQKPKTIPVEAVYDLQDGSTFTYGDATYKYHFSWKDNPNEAFAIPIVPKRKRGSIVDGQFVEDAANAITIALPEIPNEANISTNGLKNGDTVTFQGRPYIYYENEKTFEVKLIVPTTKETVEVCENRTVVGVTLMDIKEMAVRVLKSLLK